MSSCLLNSVHVELKDPPCTVQGGQEHDGSHCNIFNIEIMADMSALCKREMRPGAHGYLFCSALQFTQ